MTTKRDKKDEATAAKVAKPKKTVRDLPAGKKADGVKGGYAGTAPSGGSRR